MLNSRYVIDGGAGASSSLHQFGWSGCHVDVNARWLSRPILKLPHPASFVRAAFDYGEGRQPGFYGLARRTTLLSSCCGQSVRPYAMVWWRTAAQRQVDADDAVRRESRSVSPHLKLRCGSTTVQQPRRRLRVAVLPLITTSITQKELFLTVLLRLLASIQYATLKGCISSRCLQIDFRHDISRTTIQLGLL